MEIPEAGEQDALLIYASGMLSGLATALWATDDFETKQAAVDAAQCYVAHVFSDPLGREFILEALRAGTGEAGWFRPLRTEEPE